MNWRSLLLVGVVTAGPAMAQDPSEKKGDRPNRPGIGQRLRGPLGGGGDGTGPAPEMMARGMAMMAKNLPLMKALDLNEDGQLSVNEIESASKSLLKLDKNGDGVISEEELRPEPGMLMNAAAGPGGPRGPAAGGPAMLMRLLESRDKNGDGKLSGDEIPEMLRERVPMIDENGDGAIDKAEAEKAIARVEGRGGNRREREGGGEGVTPRRPPRGDGESDPGKN